MEKIISSIFEKEEFLIKKLKKEKNIFERKIKIDDFKIVWFAWLRWVWKTTFLLQQKLKNKNSLYISLDDLVLKNVNIFELIKEISKAYNINIFYLDEIQFLKDWENILKNIYDFLDVKIIFTVSSMIDLTKWAVDLSRRVIMSKINIFSFFEYEKYFSNKIEKISFKEIFENSFLFSKQQSSNISLLRFKKYLEFGQFGYFFENSDERIFKKLLQNSIRKSIYEDLVKFVDIHTTNISKIEDLLIFIASSASSEITINSLANKTGLSNITVEWYLKYLEKLGWVIMLNKFWGVWETIRKERKIYLSNTAILYIFSHNLLEKSVFIWNIRETFVISNLYNIKEKYDFEIFFKSRTDIVLVFNEWKKIELEIWWKNKSRKDVFVVKDDILIWDNRNIPLWMFWVID